ncbi:MAG: hypothetical protein VYE22_33710 [Myxococcota bacterium]|nr:hypothetical protein [Myxococcota bacterium]
MACPLGDVDGDGARETGGLIVRGEERRARLAMVDGATGAVVWETAARERQELEPICLGDRHFGAIDQRAFELVVVPVTGVEGEVRRSLSDEVDRYGVGRDCLTVRTDDRTIVRASLDDLSDARCDARPRIRPHIEEEKAPGFQRGIISTLRRPVVAEVGPARYELRTRRPGTPFLEVSARHGGRERWSRPLDIVPVNGEAIGTLALGASPAGPVAFGSPRGTRGRGALFMVGLDAESGAERFRRELEGYDVQGVFDNGRFVVVATRRHLYAVAPDGEIAWRL